MDALLQKVLGSSLYVLSVTTITLLSLLVVLVNGIKQVLFKKRHEPPTVFHWLPFVGSAISYGQDPIKFLSNCQAKVKSDLNAVIVVENMLRHHIR